MGTKTKKTRRGRDKMIMTKNQIIRPNKASKSCKGGSPIGLNPKTCSSRRGQCSGTSRSPHGVNDAMGAKGLDTESLVGSVRKTRFGGQAAVSSGSMAIKGCSSGSPVGSLIQHRQGGIRTKTLLRFAIG